MIALAQRWQQMEADHEAAADRLDTAWRAKDDAAHDAIDAEIEALCDRKRELLDEILATPARSPGSWQSSASRQRSSASRTNGLTTRTIWPRRPARRRTADCRLRNPARRSALACGVSFPTE